MTTDRESASENGTVATPQSLSATGRSAGAGSSYPMSVDLGDRGDAGWDSEQSRSFYRGVARRIATTLQPRTVHVMGSGSGLLVHALVELGVDATGSDNSSQRVDSTQPDVRERLRVANTTDPLPGRFDLVLCWDVLGRLAATEVEKVIEVVTAATDRVLICSAPADLDEGRVVGMQPIAPWASGFAQRGYHLRGSDVDGPLLSSWAFLLERGELEPAAIVREYEARLSPLLLELSATRQELVEARRELEDARERLAAADGAPRVVPADDAAILAVHADLTARDHLIGLEATVQRQERQIERLRDRNRELRRQLKNAEEKPSVARRLVRKGRAMMDGDRK